MEIAVEFDPAALQQIFIRRPRLVAAGIALIAFLPGPALTATKTWDAGGNTGDWSDGQNWNGTGIVPLVTDDVLFDNSGQSPLEDVFLNAPENIKSLTINLTSNQNWNLGAADGATGYTLTLATGNIFVSNTSGTGTYVVGATNVGLIGSGILSVVDTSPGFTFNNARTNGGLLQINAVVSGVTKTVTKTGAGTIILSGANTYTGATTVSEGALNIQNATGLGTTAGGTTVVSGATLQLQNNITIGVEALTISGTGASGQSGALVNVSGTNNYGGLVALGGATTIASDAGTLNLTNTGTITGATFGLTLTGAGNGSVSSVIGTTTGTLIKSGTGTWTLTGANTYTGATTISGGILKAAAGSGSALGSTSAVTVNSGGTLVLGTANQINNAAPMTLAGGTFAKGNFSEGSASAPGVGALTLTASGSHIDFGTGTVGVLTFASFTPGAFTLTIDNWTGTANTVGNGSTDRLIFASNQSANLSSFNFTGYAPGAVQFDLGNGYWEVTPAAVPETSTWVAGALAFGISAVHLVRRRRADRQSD